MSIKSSIQTLIILLILLIIGLVYSKYLDTNKKFVEEIDEAKLNSQENLKELEKKLIDLEKKNKDLIKKINENDIKNKSIKTLENKDNVISKSDSIKKQNESYKKIEKKPIKTNKEKNLKKKDIKNLVKDVEYTSVDQRGNKFYLLAKSGKSNPIDNNLLDLNNVRGKIKSDKRDTIYIVSDFAQYSSINLNSKFYQNVIIDFQDKKITCENFDINMETNKAIAYNNVIITDPKSIMKAGIVEFDLKTKDVDIRPESETKEVEVITN